MKSAIFIILLIVRGSMGAWLFDQCETDRCDDIISREDIFDEEGLPPTADKLKTLCPSILKFTKCATDLVEECTGQSPEELATSKDEVVSSIMSIFTNSKNVSEELCDEDSRLHKNYVTGISCFREVANNAGQDCIIEGIKLYNGYKDALEESIAEEFHEEERCMVVGYGFACIGQKLSKNCSAGAAEAFLDISKRLQFVKLNYCTPRDILTLKTKFLDFLEEQGEQRDFFASAFELRRRK